MHIYNRLIMEDHRSGNSFNIKPHDVFVLTLIAGLITLTCFVYWPALSGTLMLDDINTLRPLNNMGGVTSLTNLAHYLGDGTGGPLKRPVSLLAFLIDDQYFPGDPASYRYTNLMIHILCGLLLFAFFLKLLELFAVESSKKYYIATLVFALWLVHPLNVSTTAYIVQRMTQVMSLFTLLGLVSYSYGRSLLASRERAGLTLMTAALIPFGILAVLSKENGILICVYIGVLELTLLRAVYKPVWFKYWMIFFIAIPVTVSILYIGYKFGSYYAIYEYRDFTLSQRLMTELRILVSYLHQIIIPPSGGTGLFHDDIQISTSLASPITTLVSLVFIALLLALAVKFRKTEPVFSFAVLWFFGGHLLESTLIPLELYFEHRNYLPMVGPLLATVYYCLTLADYLKNKNYQRITKAVPVLLVFISSIFTYQSSTLWGKPEILYQVWYQEHPDSLRAGTMYAQLFEQHGHYDRAVELLDKIYKKHPDTIALPLYMLQISCLSNSQPKYHVSQIIEAVKLARYREVLPPITKRLVETARNTNCPQVTTDDLISILSALEDLDRLRSTAKSEIILMLAELYVSRGMLSPAIGALDRAFRISKTPVIPVRQAELLLSAGLSDDALSYIDIARKTDRNRARFRPSYSEIIDVMEQQIRKKL